MPQVYEYAGDHNRSPVTPDVEFAGAASIHEPEVVEGRRERKGESVWSVCLELKMGLIADIVSIGEF